MNDNQIHEIVEEIRLITSRRGWHRSPEARDFLASRRGMLLDEFTARKGWKIDTAGFSPESLKKGERVKGGTAPFEASFRVTLFRGMFLFLPSWFTNTEGVPVCIVSHLALDPVKIELATETIVEQAGRHGLKVCISSFPSWENPGKSKLIEYSVKGEE
ncbi:MAG TPA: hypothetical protein PK200_03135 [Spirochaetota bacterium]|nr:hypothetical protein [Spirochaetota bacterium]HQO04319.1 hypothetical protein [Spirochaetota bacterium]